MEASPVLTKIRKLFALAQSTNPHEAAAAIAAANRIMLEHRLTAAEVEGDKETGRYERETFAKCIRMPVWRSMLLRSIAQHTGCVILEQSEMALTHWIFVGTPENIAVAKALSAQAILEIARLASRDCKGLGRSVNRSYCIGAVAGLREQLRREQAAAEVTATSKAIVLVNSESGRVMAFLSKEGCRKTPSRKLSVLGMAYEKGRLQGEKLNLGKKAIE